MYSLLESRLGDVLIADRGRSGDDICQRMLRRNRLENNDYVFDEDDGDIRQDECDFAKSPEVGQSNHIRGRGRRRVAQQTMGFNGGTSSSGTSAGSCSGDETLYAGQAIGAALPAGHGSRCDDVIPAVDNMTSYEKIGRLLYIITYIIIYHFIV